MATAHHDEHPSGILRWLTTTNHKDIGTLYLVFAFTMAIIGGLMSLVIRAELWQPGLQVTDPHFFNQMTTVHALVMIFGFVMPAFTGLANWMIPIMVGAPDMALPRLNNWSFWILPFAATLLVLLACSCRAADRPPAGRCMRRCRSRAASAPTSRCCPSICSACPPSSARSTSSPRILNMRAPGMTLMKMPMFVWTWFITAYLLLATMPVLAGVITMLITDRHFGTHFFDAGGGGDPVLFQHIFWFFGHPGGVYPDPAGVRRVLADHPDVRAQTAVRL